MGMVMADPLRRVMGTYERAIASMIVEGVIAAHQVPTPHAGHVRMERLECGHARYSDLLPPPQRRRCGQCGKEASGG